MLEVLEALVVLEVLEALEVVVEGGPLSSHSNKAACSLCRKILAKR